MKFLLFLFSFFLLMINVVRAPVYHTKYVTNPESYSAPNTSSESYTTSDTNPESLVTTTPSKYFDPATETVNKAFANTTDTTPKGFFFYVFYSFKFQKWRMLLVFKYLKLKILTKVKTYSFFD